MKGLYVALWAELMKVRKSSVFVISLIFFVFVALMMGMLIYIGSHPDVAAKLGIVGAKAKIIGKDFSGWQSYFTLLEQALAALGMIGFGFVTSWVFGREYSDRTVKDMLALPVSRQEIVTAKFLVITLWCIILAVVFYSSSLATGFLSGIPGWSGQLAGEYTSTFTKVALMTILICTPVGYVASLSHGYLLPFAFLILVLIIANFSGLIGLAPYFPWAIPGVLTVPASEGIQLNGVSYIIVIATCLLGYAGTLYHWIYADQK